MAKKLKRRPERRAGLADNASTSLSTTPDQVGGTTPKTSHGGYTAGTYAGYSGPRVGGTAAKTGMASGTASKRLVSSTRRKNLRTSSASPAAKAAQRRTR
jgi:hypothetical protein